MSPALHEGALPLVPPGKPSVLLSLILLRFIHLHCFECQYFDCVDHNKLENSERDGNTRPLDLPLDKPICRSGSKVRTGHGTTDWFQIGKGVKAVYCHPA